MKTKAIKTSATKKVSPQKFNMISMSMEDKFQTLVLCLKKNKKDIGVTFKFDSSKAFKSGNFKYEYVSKVAWEIVKAVYPEQMEDAKSFIENSRKLYTPIRYILNASMMKEKTNDERIVGTYNAIDDIFSFSTILTLLEFSNIQDAILLFFLIQNELMVNWSKGEEE